MIEPEICGPRPTGLWAGYAPGRDKLLSSLAKVCNLAFMKFLSISILLMTAYCDAPGEVNSGKYVSSEETNTFFICSIRMIT